ncbi:MAG: ribosome biosis GTPase RsgA [Firmicutes bacterium]|nr:ribosome biosis GTPase RsgA [Bacillota bacterium]
MQQGVVVKAYSGYYYVQTGDKVAMCTLRGRFKKERFSLLVGDKVKIGMLGEGKGVVEEILPRHSLLKRPMAANVDQVMLMFAVVNPDINISLVDKFLVLAESSGLTATICLNKIDLADTAMLTPIVDLYQHIGYTVILSSSKTGVGLEDLRRHLYDHITVFAGPSGAGKSSMLNAVEPGLQLVTGEVSKKIGRGKHTTRYAELLPLSSGGFVVDTPGFSFTEFTDIPPVDLGSYFPEIAEYITKCKFNTCVHDKEPKCAVKHAVEEGKIAKERYNSYLEILNEVRENKKGL